MDTLNRLLKIHKPLGIYSLEPDSNICKELTCYAQVLDEVCSELLKAQKELFLLTMEDYGLRSLEQAFGAVRDELDGKTRRGMLLARYSVGSGDFTPEGVNKVMAVLGVEGKVTEYPRVYRITVDISGKHTGAQRKWISSQLKEILPAHLEVDPVFEGFCFRDVDSEGRSFAQMEQKGMRWADIDIYVKA